MRAGIRWLRTSSRAWLEAGDEGPGLSGTEDAEEAKKLERKRGEAIICALVATYRSGDRPQHVQANTTF